jgi:hypothetical protein
MPPQWSSGSSTPSAYPATFPAQSSVPPVRPDADGFALWSHTAVLRRPVRVRVTGWSMNASSWGGLPYMTNTPSDLDVHSASSDEHGVYQYRLGGRRYDHPVHQAQLVTEMLAAFRHNADRRFLDRARANAQRLLDTAIVRRGALYLPYRHRHVIARAVMDPVWFSAMAQGIALSAMCRMFYVTRDRMWRHAADQLFATFQNPPRRGQPWTVHTDACGHLWLEEYPSPTHGRPMRVLNGHIFAAIGVYDYLWLTGSPPAALVLDAALTTIAHHGQEYRVPGGCSYYSLTRPVAKPAYHSTHVWQLNRLGTWTGDQRFLDLSRQLASDHPSTS